MNDGKFKEIDLETNLNELAHETLREMYLASKKVSIYSSDHPLSQKAINRTYVLMEKIFKYKRYFDLYLTSGQLFALNIKVRPSKFTDDLMAFIQKLDMNSILFRSDMSIYEFSLFLDRFVKKMPLSDHRNIMANYLKNNKIDSVKVNSDLGDRLFKHGLRMHGDIPDDYSVRNVVNQVLGDDFSYLAYLLNNAQTEDEYIDKYNQDYYHELVTYLIPEKVALVDVENLVTLISQKIINTLKGPNSVEEITPEILDEIKSLVAAVQYHEKREDIYEQVGQAIIDNGISRNLYSEFLPKTSSLKIETLEKIDDFLKSTYDKTVADYDLAEFQLLFGRLLRTGQQSKAKAVINILLEQLAGQDLDIRKNALIMARYSLAACSANTDNYVIEHYVTRIREYLSEQRETFEFSDLVWEISRRLTQNYSYEPMSRLCDILCEHRQLDNGIFTYDSFAVKKAVEDLNRQEVIAQLISDLADNTKRSRHKQIRNILVTIGSYEVATELSQIISHDSRSVRQNVLKILTQLGKSSLDLFSRMLHDDDLFMRDNHKRDLDDDKWYIVRNTIFVLGALKDPNSCRPLRLRIHDPDFRVRREIVQSLEKIGGDQAADLLIVLADDDDFEIREMAIIALGFAGTPDIVPELAYVAENRTSNIIHIINVIGKLGGAKAREFLSKILSDKELLGHLTSGRVSKEEIKLAVIKALGRMGDEESIDTIKQFSENLSISQKMFFDARINKEAGKIIKKKQS